MGGCTVEAMRKYGCACRCSLQWVPYNYESRHLDTYTKHIDNNKVENGCRKTQLCVHLSSVCILIIKTYTFVGGGLRQKSGIHQEVRAEYHRSIMGRNRTNLYFLRLVTYILIIFPSVWSSLFTLNVPESTIFESTW